MQITWTNCADEMPPYEPIIVVNLLDMRIRMSHGESLAFYIHREWRVKRRHFEWTEFTEEKWEELKK